MRKAIIGFFAWLIKPFYEIHQAAKKNAVAEGALFYIHDVAKTDRMLQQFAEQAAVGARNALKIEMEKYIDTLWTHEKEEVREHLMETLDKRLAAEKKGKKK